MAKVRTEPATTLTDLLFEKAGAGLCLVAPDGTVVRANGEWLRATGFTQEQVVGENIIELFPATSDMALAMRARARAGHRVDVPRHARDVNGRETWWEGSIEPVPMEGGTGLLITAREVARGSSASEDAQRLSLALDSGQMGMWEWDVRTDVSVWNAKEYELLGLPRGSDTVPTGRFFKAVHPDDIEALRAGLATTFSGGSSWRGEFRIVRPDGEVRWLAGTGRLFRDASGEPLRMIGVNFDVTERKRAIDAARERTAELRAVLDAVPAAIFITRDRDAARMEANRFCAEMLRMPLGTNVSKSAPEAERPRDFRAMQDGREIPPDQLPVQIAAATGREIRDYEFDLVFEDGESRRLVGNASPLLDDGGGPAGAVGAFVDITERARAEASLRLTEARLHQTLKEAAAGIWEWDLTSGKLNWGPELFDLFGLDPAEGIDYARWARCVHPDDLDTVNAAGREFAEGRTREYRGEFRILHPSIGLRWILSVGYLDKSPDGAGPVARGINIDITTRKRAEEALRQSLDGLHEADRRKDEFLAMLSHELRNPLAPIRNSTYILQHAAPGSEQARRAQAVIERQTAHLTRLVDDLLDVTRIARGKIALRRSRVDLRDVVWRAADDFQLIMRDRGVRFSITVPDERIWSDADPTRITQIVGNLLHNASKYTEKGDEVTVSLERDEHDATIRVRDTGAGIDPDLLPRIFDQFVQGDRTLSRADGGLGLGLALVKGIAELHGGSVRAASAGKGRGAEFSVRLPLMEGPAARLDPGAHASPSNVARGRRVLVVDDNHDAAESLADVVRLLGYAVEVVYDGPSAVEWARDNPPDVVFCDIGLPGMSGYDVARRLRASSVIGMQLFAVSGYAQPEDVAKAVAAGFDAHVAKPCDPEEIERLLS